MSTVQEGSEPEGFWTALGGMGEYPKVSEAEEVSQEPRLFQVGGLVVSLSAHQAGQDLGVVVLVLVVSRPYCMKVGVR